MPDPNEPPGAADAQINEAIAAAETELEQMVNDVVDSTSDQRIVNNVMRHEYRTLTEPEKAQMKMVKDLGLAFIETLHVIGGTDGNGYGSRELSLAATNAEQAVMWAVKHITR